MNPIGAIKAAFSPKSQPANANNCQNPVTPPQHSQYLQNPQYPQDSFVRNAGQCERPFFSPLSAKTKKRVPILRNGERLVPNTVYKLENVSGINLGGECRLVLNGVMAQY